MREVNATFGHEVGDEVLREAARRLSRNVLAEHVIARLGESQFLIIAPGFSAERARIYVDQLAGALRGGFHLSGMTLDLGVTSGICVYPDHGQSAQELLRRVQVALEDAADTRLRIASYEPGRDEQHRRRLTLIAGLHTAIERDQLTLKFQPKVDMATRCVKSLEALVRWQHATLGAVSPGEFVPLAESAGASRMLTNWVLGAAIRQLAAWRRERPAGGARRQPVGARHSRPGSRRRDPDDARRPASRAGTPFCSRSLKARSCAIRSLRPGTCSRCGRRGAVLAR